MEFVGCQSGTSRVYWRRAAGFAFCWLALAVGCNRAPVTEIEPTLAENGSTGRSSVAPHLLPEIPAGTLPGDVVKMFLEAVQTGDERIAGALLTQRAREETYHKGLLLEPQGSATARFHIGSTRVVTAKGDGAHVESTWTDLDKGGKPQDYRFTWILRRERVGWRIAGMATEIRPGTEPLVLNFENPDEMLAKREAAIADIARRNGPRTAPLENANREQAPPTKLR